MADRMFPSARRRGRLPEEDSNQAGLHWPLPPGTGRKRGLPLTTSGGAKGHRLTRLAGFMYQTQFAELLGSRCIHQAYICPDHRSEPAGVDPG